MKKQILFSLLLIPLTSSAMKRKHDHQELAIIKKQEPVRPTLASLWNIACKDPLKNIPIAIVNVNINNPDQAIADIASFMQINKLSEQILLENDNVLLEWIINGIKKINHLTLSEVQKKRISSGAHLQDARNSEYLLPTTRLMLQVGLFDAFYRPHIFHDLPLPTIMDEDEKDVPLARVIYQHNPKSHESPYSMAVCCSAEKQYWDPSNPYADNKSFYIIDVKYTIPTCLKE